MLIGIDHPRLHTWETKQAANLVARHLPLGWVVFGAKPREHAHVHHVLNVKLSAPIDITDFWSTESMGVAMKPCDCEADKLNPVERKEVKIIEDSCQRIGTQWLILYPWKRDPSTLPNNRLQAEKKLEAPTLCIFSDASNEAFGACAYIRWQTESSSFNTRFIAAKSRVAILKTADCTSSRATRSSTGNQAISVHHWGNTSEIHESRTLHRQQYSVVVDPQSCQRTQAICIRRIAEIQSNSDSCQWRHVPEEFNV